MAVMKIDDELLEKVRNFIKQGDNRFDYPSVKAFVDKAVYVFLKENMKKK